MKIHLFFTTLLTVFSCATRTYQSQGIYNQNLKQWSRSEKNYEGFSNTMQADLTFFHPRFVESQVIFKSEIYGWDQEKLKTQMALELSEASSKSKAFLAFYTPERRLNQLARNQTPWRVFLDVEGKRIQAEIKRNRVALAELRLLYPFVTRWHIPYDLIFDIPSSALSGKTFTIQIAGPVGQQIFTFSSP